MVLSFPMTIKFNVVIYVFEINWRKHLINYTFLHMLDKNKIRILLLIYELDHFRLIVG